MKEAAQAASLHLVGFYITVTTLIMHGQTQIKPTELSGAQVRK